jgi:1-acyl-sn-glycerol-3-phosphate acyltransferase
VSIAGLALWALFALIVLVGLGFFARAVCNNPRHEPSTGMLAAILRLYTRIVHRVRYEGLGLIPPSGRPTLFVCNHTAGIDPLLVHLVSGHDIRWMMARDMRTPMLETFWNWMRIIDVDRIAGDPAAAREALRELAQGGSVGIFPEGGLERPPRQLIPFEPGVGLIIKKSRAIVVPVVIDGTPQVDPAFASLWHPSRSRVTFHEPINYEDSGLGAKDIAQDLFDRYRDWTGWPVNENPREIEVGRSK